MIGRCRYGRFGQALLPRLGTSPRSQASYTRWAAHWSRSANGLEINTPITRSRGHGIRTVALWVNRRETHIQRAVDRRVARIDPRRFGVDVIDRVAEGFNNLYSVHSLVEEMTRIEVCADYRPDGLPQTV